MKSPANAVLIVAVQKSLSLLRNIGLRIYGSYRLLFDKNVSLIAGPHGDTNLHLEISGLSYATRWNLPDVLTIPLTIALNATTSE